MKKFISVLTALFISSSGPLLSMNPESPFKIQTLDFHNLDSTEFTVLQKLDRLSLKETNEIHRQRQKKLNHVKIKFKIKQPTLPSMLEAGRQATFDSIVRNIIISATGPAGTIAEAILAEIIAMAKKRYEQGTLNPQHFFEALKTITLNVFIGATIGRLKDIPGFQGTIKNFVDNMILQPLQRSYNRSQGITSPPRTPQQKIRYNNQNDAFEIYIEATPPTAAAYQTPEEIASDLAGNTTETIMSYLFGS